MLRRPIKLDPHTNEEVAAKKSYKEILHEEIEVGDHELHRSAYGLFLSGLSAGLDAGFGVLVLAVVTFASAPGIAPLLSRLIQAAAYSVGFILVIFGRSELFTEHTALAVLPVLARRATLLQLLRLWVLVYVSNLCGAALFAGMMAWLGPSLGIFDASTLLGLGERLMHSNEAVMLASAVLAGWMMGLVSWLVTAGRDTVGQIIFVFLVTGSIGLCGLHHCVVGSVEVLGAVFATGTISLADYFRFLGLSTLGNAIGGTVFVALLRFAHARAGETGPT